MATESADLCITVWLDEMRSTHVAAITVSTVVRQSHQYIQDRDAFDSRFPHCMTTTNVSRFTLIQQ